MGIYVTREEFRTFAIPSGSYPEPTTTITGQVSKGVANNIVDFYITGSCQQVDAAMRNQHTVPLAGLDPSKVPHSVKWAVICITSQRLQSHVGLPPEKVNLVTSLYNEIVGKGGYLDRIRDGSEQLDSTADKIDAGTGHLGRPQCGALPSSSRNIVTLSDGTKIEYV